MKEIADAIASIKAAIDISSALRDIDTSIKTSEMKLRIADLMDALADAKLSIAAVKDIVVERDAEIERLKLALATTPHLARFGNAHYEARENAAKRGDPYCSHCWETERLAVHIAPHVIHDWYHVCPRCKNTVKLR